MLDGKALAKIIKPCTVDLSDIYEKEKHKFLPALKHFTIDLTGHYLRRESCPRLSIDEPTSTGVAASSRDSRLNLLTVLYGNTKYDVVKPEMSLRFPASVQTENILEPNDFDQSI